MKGYHSLIIILLFPFLSHAQGGDWKWVTGGFQNDHNYGNKIRLTHNGDIIMVGGYRNTFTSGSISLQSQGLQDIFISRYTNTGQLLWAKSIGAHDEDWATGVVEDGSGNLYVTGYFMDTVAFESTTLYSRDSFNANLVADGDIFLAKYDGSGNLIWAKQAGGPLQDRGNAIAYDGKYIYVGGVFGGDKSNPPFSYAQFDNTIVTSLGQNSMFLAKYDTAGSLIWVKPAGGRFGGGIYGLSIDTSHNIHIVGSFTAPYSYFDTIKLYTGTGGYGFGDMFVAMYDSSGKALWAKGGGGDRFTDGSAIATDKIGNTYATGLMSSNVTHFGGGFDLHGYTDLFNAYIVKYAPSGNIVWAKNAGVNTEDNNYAEGGILLDNQSNIYLTGTFSNDSYFGGDTLQSYGTKDIMVCKYDNSGNPISFTHAGGNLEDDGNDIAMDSLGNLYVSGVVGSHNATFGSHLLTNSSNMYSVFLAKLSPYANWINAVSNTSGVYLYPNPSNGSFTFYYGNAAFKEFTIYNALGQVVLTMSVDIGKQSEGIALPDLPNGAYFLSAKGVKGSIVKKLIIEH